MRRLLYVPIIHTESELGDLAPAIDRASASLCGEKRWSKHKEAVSNFWKAIEDYIVSLDGANLKIYQDGMAVEGDLGRKIVEEAAKRGSKNYQIVLHLMNKGAEIRRTEDVSLLMEEYEGIVHLTQEKSTREKTPDYAQYKLRKERLTKERDQFIARRINESLKPGETAILFLGAYHDVLPHLAKDIVVKSIKEPEKVRAYFQELLAGRDEERYQRQARYLASSISNY